MTVVDDGSSSRSQPSAQPERMHRPGDGLIAALEAHLVPRVPERVHRQNLEIAAYM
jgi:hypothetical protein